MSTTNRFLAFFKLLGLVVILMLPVKAFAGYYVESEPVPVVACASCSPYSATYVYHPCHYCHHSRHHYYHHVYHHVYHRYSSYRIDKYYVWHMPPPPPCYSCGCSSCGSCYSSCGGCGEYSCHSERVYYERRVVYSPAPSYYYTSNYDTATADFNGDP